MIVIVKKIVSIISLIMFLIFVNTVVNAKYIFDNEFEIANINIDRMKPVIELISIENNNTGYENYANKTHTINVTVKFKDKNIDKVFCDQEHVKVKINDTYVQVENMKFIKLGEQKGEQTYKIQLKDMNLNGKLKLEFIEGTVIDKSLLENDIFEVDTKILLDNIAPNGSPEENLISEGKSKITITLSEGIRPLEGWEFSADKLKIQKEFTNNISYELPIIDYAGNEGIVNIDVTKATNINLVYASHNSEVGWTYGYGNYDIAGEEVIKRNAKFKTEAIAFNFGGNVDDDFIQVNAYVHTYWGEGATVKCSEDVSYRHGYNPSENTYKSMKSQLVTIEGKQYFQLGGGGVNFAGNTSTKNNDPIPDEVASKYPFGISGLKMILKDYSYYSIVYQIYVDGVGWINACSDGQECMASKNKPMSAFRIALIPKTEKQYVIDTWNKDV